MRGGEEEAGGECCREEAAAKDGHEESPEELCGEADGMRYKSSAEGVRMGRTIHLMRLNLAPSLKGVHSMG
jgi:hypothetical protein